MDGGLQILTNFGENVWWARGEEEEQRGEERGKGEEQSELDEGFICRRTYSTGSWHEPELKVRHEPVLMKAARLAVGTGTNVYISAGSNTNRH